MDKLFPTKSKMYQYDEETISGSQLSQDEAQRRETLVNDELPSVPVIETVQTLQQEYRAKLVMRVPIQIFHQVNIGMMVPCIVSRTQLRMWDAAQDTFSETEEWPSQYHPDARDANGDFTLVIKNPSREWPQTGGLRPGDVILVDIIADTDQPNRVLTLQWRGSDEIKQTVVNSIKTAFALIESFEILQSQGQVVYFRIPTPNRLNSAIWFHLILNDPILSKLYTLGKRFGAKKDTTSIQLSRLNEDRDPVTLTQVSPQEIAVQLKTQNPDVSGLVRKISASIVLAQTRTQNIQNTYSQLAPPGSDLTKQFRLQITLPQVQDDFEDDFYDIEDAAPARPDPDVIIPVAMQNNPSVSAESLAELARSGPLSATRWASALAEVDPPIDVYLFNAGGLVLPRSRYGLYTRDSTADWSVFVFVREDDTCMIIGKDILNTEVKVANKSYVNMKPKVDYACLPDNLVPILGPDYYMKKVPNPRDIVECLKQARKQLNKTNTWGEKFDMLLPNSTIILENTSSDLQDVKQTVEEVDNILIMQKSLSEFYVGSRRIAIGLHNPITAISEQIIDSAGKYCGSPGLPRPAAAPFPEISVAKAEPSGLLTRFMDRSRCALFLIQICLKRFSQQYSDAIADPGSAVRQFIEDNLRKTAQYPPLSSFNAILENNFKNMRIPVPDLEAFQFELEQRAKNPQGLQKFKSRVFLEYFFLPGARRENGTIQLPFSRVEEFRMEKKQKPQTFKKEPIEGNETYYLQVNRGLAKAKNYNSFEEAQRNVPKKHALYIFQNGKFTIKTPSLIQNKRAIVGWKNQKEKPVWTTLKFLV